MRTQCYITYISTQWYHADYTLLFKNHITTVGPRTGFELSSSTYMQTVFKKYLYCFRFAVSVGTEGKLYVLWIYAFSIRDSCITIFGYPQGSWNQFPAGIRDNLSFWEDKLHKHFRLPGKGKRGRVGAPTAALFKGQHHSFTIKIW